MAKEIDTKKVVTTWEWLIYFFILSIPLVNIIIVFVDAFGSNRNENKKSFCRAILLTFVLTIIAAVLTIVLFGVVLQPMLDEIMNMSPEQQQQMMYELNRALNTGK